MFFLFFGNYQMNYIAEFDLYIDIVLIVYMFCANFFFKGWYEKIVILYKILSSDGHD